MQVIQGDLKVSFSLVCISQGLSIGVTAMDSVKNIGHVKETQASEMCLPKACRRTIIIDGFVNFCPGGRQIKLCWLARRIRYIRVQGFDDLCMLHANSSAAEIGGSMVALPSDNIIIVL